MSTQFFMYCSKLSSGINVKWLQLPQTGLFEFDKFDSDVSNSSLNFEYYFEPWVNNFQYSGQNPNAYNAISTFIIIKSDQQIEPATISN